MRRLHCGSRSKIGVCIAVVTLTVLVVNTEGYAQQPPPSTKTSEIDVASLRAGIGCRVWTKKPHGALASPPDNTGTVREVTNDHIIVSEMVEGSNEIRTPLLGSLPFIGKFFTRVEIGHAETVTRIPIEKIERIDIVPPYLAKTSKS